MTTTAAQPFAFAFTRPLTLAEAKGDLWVQILTVGEWKHPEYGTLSITADDLRELVKNFDAGARHDVYADFDHGIARASGDGNAIRAGDVRKLETRNKGRELWALYEPTTRARERIEAKEYRYTSADFATAYRDKTTGKTWGKVLRGFALTNTPFIEGMHPLTLGEAGSEPPVLFADFTTTEPSGDAGRETLMPKLAETLGLKSDATDEQIEAKVKQLSEGFDKAVDQLEDIREALQLSDDADLVAETKKFAGERNELRKKSREAEADRLLAAALRDGRIMPAVKTEFRARLLHENGAVATATRELLEKMPKGTVRLSDRTAQEGTPIVRDSGKRLDEKVDALRKADPKLSYRDALILAEREIGQVQDAAADDEVDGEAKGE